MSSDPSEQKAREPHPNWFIAWIGREISTMKGAPLSFVSFLALGAIGTFLLYQNFIIPNKDAIIEKLSKTPAELAPPNFIISTPSIQTFDIDKNHLGVLVNVEIRNSGSESIAVDWHLTIQQLSNTHSIIGPPELSIIGDGDPVEIETDTPIPNGESLKVFKVSESLVGMTIKNKIENGGFVRGKILFIVKDPVPQILDDKTIFTTSVEDIHGKVFMHEAQFHFK